MLIIKMRRGPVRHCEQRKKSVLRQRVSNNNIVYSENSEKFRIAGS